MDADKEGFLRSERSLIQTAGRSARHVSGEVILYADTMTGSMRRAIEETQRRRRKQLAFNKKHGIVPRSIVKSPEEVLRATSVADAAPAPEQILFSDTGELPREDLIRQMESDMLEAARRLEFEKAASLRDRIEELKGTV
jgi:excinuclease ABC subunit B